MDGDKRVTDLRLVCKGDCDNVRNVLSMQLGQVMGAERAWECAELMFRTYKWTAEMRRKLFAILRDASRLTEEA